MKEGSFVDEIFKLKYVLFFENSEYVIVYEEGYDLVKCFIGKEIVNFYSFCDNLFFICDIIFRVLKLCVMFIILLCWDLSLFVESGVKRFNWDEFYFVINFFVIVKVNLCFLFGIRKCFCVY